MSPIGSTEYMNDSTPLLSSKVVDERRTRSSYSIQTVLLTVASMVSLLCLSFAVYAPRSNLYEYPSFSYLSEAMNNFTNSSHSDGGSSSNSTNVTEAVGSNSSSGDEDDLPICDYEDAAQCAHRFLGYCYERVPCQAGAPTSYPTPAPSTEIDCDPSNPPCAQWILGVCWAHYSCDENAGYPSSIPTARPSNLENCDPHNPPCTYDVLGLCWEYANCYGGGEGLGTPTSVPTPKVRV